MSDLVESACDLANALDRVRVANAASDAAWDSGIPSYEIADELLHASEAVRVAIVALTGAAGDQVKP